MLYFEDEIVDAVVDAENCWPPDGDEPFWESTTNYVETRVQIGHYYARWNWVLDELKHNRRFFNTSAEALFGEIFDGVDELQAWDGRRSRPVVRILSKGTTLFRARILNSEAMFKDVYAEPLKHIGPPPKEAARAGRMNAEGIVVFYGSREQKTCLAEMRPALGNELAVISLETTKPLRVLDFSRLDQARGGKVLSYFQPDFSSEVEKSAFLRRIHALISQPILPGKEADYLITQTMAEYLSHVHDKPFDGILFASAQRNGGTNVVLFAKENMDLVTDSISDVFRLSYVDSTLEIFSTNSISYKHRKVDVYIDDKTGEPWRYDQHNGDDEDE